ncbi:MAG TPA: hypothetical protein VGR20_22860 [Acidimicrobiia bacterium]|nr:hypothetical protein [Acidimicrobiia bacterium]
MLKRTRTSLVAVLLVASLAGVACGGGEGKPKAGTPAATGVAPDCSVAPLDVVKTSLGLELTGPIVDPTPGGTFCTFAPLRGGNASHQVKLVGNVDKASFALARDGFKAANNPVKKIGGWGDEAYAASVFSYSDINTFAVRKGKVSVTIISPVDYDHIKKLMKVILQKV